MHFPFYFFQHHNFPFVFQYLLIIPRQWTQQSSGWWLSLLFLPTKVMTSCTESIGKEHFQTSKLPVKKSCKRLIHSTVVAMYKMQALTVNLDAA